MLLEVPNSSQNAQCFSIFIVFTIFLSITGFVLETVPDVYNFSPVLWMVVEMMCTGIFSVEFGLRLFVCDEAGSSRLRFLCTPLNLFDLVAVLPFYIELLLHAVGQEDNPAVRALRVVRLTRVSRILKLGRYAAGMRLMGEAPLDLVSRLCETPRRPFPCWYFSSVWVSCSSPVRFSTPKR